MLMSVLIFSFLLTPAPSNESTEQERHINGNGNCEANEGNSTLDTGNKIFDFSPFKRTTYMLYCIGITSVAFGYYIPDIDLPEYAVSIGLTEQKAANLISIFGFANLGSRIVFWIVADFGPRTRLCFCGLPITFLGVIMVISIVLPFFKSYPIFIAYAILFGIFIGGIASLFSVVLVDVYGLNLLEKSLGQAMAFLSPVYIFGSPLIGFLIDKSGTVELAFYIPGIVTTLGGLVFLSILCFHDFDKQKYEGITKCDIAALQSSLKELL